MGASFLPASSDDSGSFLSPPPQPHPISGQGDKAPSERVVIGRPPIWSLPPPEATLRQPSQCPGRADRCSGSSMLPEPTVPNSSSPLSSTAWPPGAPGSLPPSMSLLSFWGLPHSALTPALHRTSLAEGKGGGRVDTRHGGGEAALAKSSRLLGFRPGAKKESVCVCV